MWIFISRSVLVMRIQNTIPWEATLDQERLAVLHPVAAIRRSFSTLIIQLQLSFDTQHVEWTQ
jgi:hypothetical protein